jgi:hypothetical protein
MKQLNKKTKRKKQQQKKQGNKKTKHTHIWVPRFRLYISGFLFRSVLFLNCFDLDS